MYMSPTYSGPELVIIFYFLKKNFLKKLVNGMSPILLGQKRKFLMHAKDYSHTEFHADWKSRHFKNQLWNPKNTKNDQKRQFLK